MDRGIKRHRRSRWARAAVCIHELWGGDGLAYVLLGDAVASAHDVDAGLGGLLHLYALEGVVCDGRGSAIYGDVADG